MTLSSSSSMSDEGRRRGGAGATRRAFLAAAAASVAFPWGAAGASAPDDDARALVSALIDEALTVLDGADSEALREAEFRRLLNAYFDLPVIARLVLGAHWRSATDEQRRLFSRAFEDHLVKVYVSRLGAYGGEEVAVRDAAPRNDTHTVVKAEVVRAGEPPIAIDWLVRRTGAEFHVIDLALEGVSMLTTKRSEFRSIIDNEGLDSLIARLEALNAAGEEERPRDS